MRRPLQIQMTLLILGGLLATGSGCGICNPRHGMLLRGDWSLELNRVPWLNSRTQSYDEVGEGCDQGTMVQPPMSPQGCVDTSGAPVACPTQPVAHSCQPGPLACRMCSGSRADGRAAPPQRGAHSRFHPVPTRPVFTPWNCPAPDPRAHAPHRPQTPRMQQESELIPTPEASQSSMQPTRAASPTTSSAWVFQPEGGALHEVASR